MKFIFYLLVSIYITLSFLQAESKENLEDNKYEANFLAAQKNKFISQHGNLVISDMEIIGAKRTKKILFVRIAKLNASSKLSDFNPDFFVNEINKRGILADIKLDYKVVDGKAVINVTVKEKWTLIPIPTISNSGESSSYGLFLLETNFLGLNKMLGMGAIISNTGNMFLLSYADQNIFQTNFTSAIALITSTQTLESKTWTQKNDDPYQEFRTKVDVVAYQLGYKFNSHFTPSIKTNYKNFKVSESYEDSLMPPEDASIFSYGIGLDLDFQSYHDYFKYGFSTSLDVEKNIFSSINEDTNYNVYTFDMSYYKKLPNYSRLKIDVNAKASDKFRPILDQGREGGSLGMYSLPADTLLINNYANITLGFEQAIYKKSWGLISSTIFWEQGIFNGGLNYDYIDNTYKTGTSMHHYYASGASVQFYLKDIAIPSIGFSYAYNMQSKEGLFKLVAGFAV